MINKFHKFVNIKLIIKFLFWFTILQVLSFHFSFTTFAEAPKNYLKGKFFESVENNFLIATEKMLDDRFKKTLIVEIKNLKNVDENTNSVGKYDIQYFL